MIKPTHVMFIDPALNCDSGVVSVLDIPSGTYFEKDGRILFKIGVGGCQAVDVNGVVILLREDAVIPTRSIVDQAEVRLVKWRGSYDQ